MIASLLEEFLHDGVQFAGLGLEHTAMAVLMLALLPLLNVIATSSHRVLKKEGLHCRLLSKDHQTWQKLTSRCEHERDEWTSLNVNEMSEVWTRQVLGLAVVWQQVIFKQVTHLFLVLLKHLYNYQVTFSVFYKIYRPSSYNKQNFYDNTNLFNCNWEWAQVCIKERPQAYHHSGPQVRTGKLLAKSSDHLTQECTC